MCRATRCLPFTYTAIRTFYGTRDAAHVALVGVYVQVWVSLSIGYCLWLSFPPAMLLATADSCSLALALRTRLSTTNGMRMLSAESHQRLPTSRHTHISRCSRPFHAHGRAVSLHPPMFHPRRTIEIGPKMLRYENPALERHLDIGDASRA